MCKKLLLLTFFTLLFSVSAMAAPCGSWTADDVLWCGDGATDSWNVDDNWWWPDAAAHSGYPDVNTAKVRVGLAMRYMSYPEHCNSLGTLPDPTLSTSDIVVSDLYIGGSSASCDSGVDDPMAGHTLYITGGTMDIANQLIIGDGGRDSWGKVAMSGGLLRFDNGYCGYNGSTGYLDMTGGTLEVTGGGGLRMGRGSHNDTLGTAVVSIKGASTLYNATAGQIKVGYNGNAVMDINDGATVYASDDLRIGEGGGGRSSGTINVIDGLLQAHEHLHVGVYAGNGYLNLTGGTTHVRWDLHLGHDGGTGVVDVGGSALLDVWNLNFRNKNTDAVALNLLTKTATLRFSIDSLSNTRLETLFNNLRFMTFEGYKYGEVDTNGLKRHTYSFTGPAHDPCGFEDHDYMLYVNAAEPNLNQPWMPNPVDGALLDVPNDIVLTWKAGPDVTNYEVFLGTVSGSLSSVGTTLHPITSYDPNLDPDTTYYWQVKCDDGLIVTETGKEWSFKTAPLGLTHNHHYAGRGLTDTWSDPTAWNHGHVPTATQNVQIRNTGSLMIIDGENAVCKELVVARGESATLQMKSGTLAAEQIHVGNWHEGFGIMELSGGTIAIDSGNGDFLMGWDGGGRLKMTGGKIICRDFKLRSGREDWRSPRQKFSMLELSDGVIDCNDFSMTDPADITNMTGCTIIANGDKVTQINTYITDGKMMAYGGAGSLNVVYDSGDDETTVTVNVADLTGDGNTDGADLGVIADQWLKP